jgi:hypothetical protein
VVELGRGGGFTGSLGWRVRLGQDMVLDRRGCL